MNTDTLLLVCHKIIWNIISWLNGYIRCLLWHCIDNINYYNVIWAAIILKLLWILQLVVLLLWFKGSIFYSRLAFVTSEKLYSVTVYWAGLSSTGILIVMQSVFQGSFQRAGSETTEFVKPWKGGDSVSAASEQRGYRKPRLWVNSSLLKVLTSNLGLLLCGWQWKACLLSVCVLYSLRNFDNLSDHFSQVNWLTYAIRSGRQDLSFNKINKYGSVVLHTFKSLTSCLY